MTTAKEFTVIDSAILKSQLDKGLFNEAMFNLKTGFEGVWKGRPEIREIENEDGEITSFAIEYDSTVGKTTLYDSTLRSCFLLTKDQLKELKKVDQAHADIKSVWFWDDTPNKEYTAMKELMKEAAESGEDFAMPANLKVVGALVWESPEKEGKPMVGLRYYKGVDKLRRFHKKQGTKYHMRKSDAISYLEAGEINNMVVKDFKPDAKYYDDPSKWTFRLLLADWRE